MRTRTVAANKLRSAFHGGSANNITAHLVSLPEGHDPNSFFVAGGDAHEFRLLENARCDSMSLNNTH